MPDSFIELPVEVEPTEIALDAFAFLTAAIPGWEPAEANLDTLLIQADAEETAVDRALMVEVSTNIFRYIGSVFGVDPLDATTAIAASTWTLTDTAGHTIPEGTQVAVTAPDGSQIGFRTTAAITVTAGSSVTATGEVPLESVDTGAATSGLTGPVDLIDQLAFVQSVAIIGVTTGGTDGETDAEYVGRLAERLRLQSEALILPRDFEIIARDIASVARAVAVDGYDADTDTPDQERCITVAVVDDAGEPIPSPDKALLAALYQLNRETTFLSFVIDPTYTDIDVAFTATALPGFIPADVETNAEAAITAFLSPANWGLPSSGDGDVDWVNKTTVRFQELVTVLNNVEGIDYYTALTVEGGTADVSLTGVVTLTRPGTIAGTVNAP